MSFLIKYRVKRSNIDYTEFTFDRDFIENFDKNSDNTKDKIVTIPHNKNNFKNIIQLFKSKLLLNDLNISTFINHIDPDEYYYIKDLFVDLTYPLNTEVKREKTTSFYKEILQNIIKQEFNFNEILFNTTPEIKSIIQSITKNSNVNQNKKKLFVFTSQQKKEKSNEYQIDPKKDIIENFLISTLEAKFKKNVTNQIVNIFKCVNDLDFGGSLIYKLKELNSQKIEYTLSYLTEIFNEVHLINSLTSNIMKEEFYLVCVNKIKNSYLNNVPIIPFEYMPVNYSELINIIYFIKIIKKKLLNLYLIIDHYIFINGYEKNNYNKFEYYYEKLLEIDEYKKYIEWIQ